MYTRIDMVTSTSSAVRRARLLAVFLLLLALRLHGDAAVSTRPKLHDADLPWNDAFWANETADVVSAVIATHTVAGGSHWYVRRWLSKRCRPRGGIDGDMDDAATGRCYFQGLRWLDKRADQRRSDEDKFRRLLELMSIHPIAVPFWPEKIVNPAIPSRPRLEWEGRLIFVEYPCENCPM